MKILYICSGFEGIYSFIDQKIINAIIHTHNDCQSVSLFSGLTNIKEVIMDFKPRFVLTTVGYTFPPQLRDWIQDKGIPIALWLTEDPYYIDLTLPIINKYNFIFTIDMAAYDLYKRNLYQKIHFLPIGTDTNEYKPRANDPKYKSDICLIGSPYPNRIQTMKYLLDKTNYHFFIAGAEWNKVLANYLEGSNLTIVEWVPPELASHYFSNAKVNLNIHRPFDLEANSNSKGVIPKSVNNRTFDIAACKAFQIIVSSTKLELPFQENKEIVFVQSDVDLLAKVEYYLKNEDERKCTASESYRKVLDQYTITHCTNEIINVITGTEID